MKPVIKSIQIKAPRDRVWKVLWEDRNYRAWTKFFDTGSYMSGKLALGETVKFLGPDGGGLVAKVSELIVNEVVVFTFIGMMDDGELITDDEDMWAWIGKKESYHLTETGGVTTLATETIMEDDYYEQMSKAWDQGLAKVREMAEKIPNLNKSMSLLVLAYPKLSEKDYDFIQKYRKVHDKKYFTLVEPHFSVVFQTSILSEEEFIEEIFKQSLGLHAVDFKLKRAIVNQDDSGNYYHEFLVPDEGMSDIFHIHDKLYGDKLHKARRFDINFIPHIGVGNSEDVYICDKNVNNLNKLHFCIEGILETLDIVKYENNKITTLEKIKLTHL